MFYLGAFTVATTTHKHLNRCSGVNPVMIGPLLIHQKKEKVTYSIFTDYLLNSRPQLQTLQVLGSDGEVALSLPSWRDALNLSICFVSITSRITSLNLWVLTKTTEDALWPTYLVNRKVQDLKKVSWTLKMRKNFRHVSKLSAMCGREAGGEGPRISPMVPKE